MSGFNVVPDGSSIGTVPLSKNSVDKTKLSVHELAMKAMEEMEKESSENNLSKQCIVEKLPDNLKIEDYYKLEHDKYTKQN